LKHSTPFSESLPTKLTGIEIDATPNAISLTHFHFNLHGAAVFHVMGAVMEGMSGNW
jgi:hypothetical protein